MPAPPSPAPIPYTLASYPETTTLPPYPPPSDSQLTNEVDGMEYESNEVSRLREYKIIRSLLSEPL